MIYTEATIGQQCLRGPSDLVKAASLSRAVVLKLCASGSPRWLVKTEIARPHTLRVSDSAGLG